MGFCHKIVAGSGLKILSFGVKIGISVFHYVLQGVCGCNLRCNKIVTM